MNVKLFAGKIKKLSNNRRWLVLLAAYLLAVSISIDGWPVYVTLVVVSILCCISFYNQYTSIQKYEDGLSLETSITSCMKYHGFPGGTYLGYVMKRFLPVQIVMAAAAMVRSIVDADLAKAAVGGIVFLMPFFVWQIRKALFQYVVTHRERAWFLIMGGMGNGFIWLISLMAVVIIFGMTAIFVYAVITEPFLLQNDNVASIGFSHGGWRFTALALGTAVWSGVLFSRQDILKKYHLKAATNGVVALLFAANLLNCAANHTVVEENTITVTKNFVENKYRFEDVNRFEIFEDEKEQSIAMRFYCENGENISVTIAEYSTTEQWNQRYRNECEFVKDVAAQLLEMGAEGGIREPEQLFADMVEYWDSGEYEDEKNTLREIMEMLPQKRK